MPHLSSLSLLSSDRGNDIYHNLGLSVTGNYILVYKGVGKYGSYFLFLGIAFSRDYIRHIYIIFGWGQSSVPIGPFGHMARRYKSHGFLSELSFFAEQ